MESQAWAPPAPSVLRRASPRSQPTSVSGSLPLSRFPRCTAGDSVLHPRCEQVQRVQVLSACRASGLPGSCSPRTPGASRFGRAEALAFPRPRCRFSPLSPERTPPPLPHLWPPAQAIALARCHSAGLSLPGQGRAASRGRLFSHPPLGSPRTGQANDVLIYV